MNRPNKPRTHLFSPHTDQCVYCGKSAEDDAIENLPCGSYQPVSCGACGGKGWLWCSAEGDHPPREEIRRCNACHKFANDQAALRGIVKAAQSQPALFRFVKEVALLMHEGEPDDEGKPFEITSDDDIATLNQLILEARQLLGTAGKCDVCGETVPYVIGCPDGAEVCQDCFADGHPPHPIINQQPSTERKTSNVKQKIIIRSKLIAENAAAISDRVHSNPDQYRQLYGRMGESLGGFPGIWSLIADCALELEKQHPEEWQDGWIESCWAVGDLILAMENATPVSELVDRAIHSKQDTHAPMCCLN